MSNAIDFLESLGRDAELRHAGLQAMKAALIQAQVDYKAQEAILARDASRLRKEMGCGELFAIQMADDEGELGRTNH